MIGPDNQARILDFGIGSLLVENEGESLVDTMSTANTLTSGLDCASPESIMEPTNRTPAGDQYSLGCVLYYCLTGPRAVPGGQRGREDDGPPDARSRADPGVRPGGAGRAGRGRRQADGEEAGGAVRRVRRGGRGAGAVRRRCAGEQHRAGRGLGAGRGPVESPGWSCPRRVAVRPAGCRRWPRGRRPPRARTSGVRVPTPPPLAVVDSARQPHPRPAAGSQARAIADSRGRNNRNDDLPPIAEEIDEADACR